MKLEIFDKIIFGELQPFSIENQDEKKFEKILTPSIKSPASLEEFNKALLRVMIDHPNIEVGVGYNIKMDEEKKELVISNMKDKVFEPLIDLDLPPFVNSTTEYYHFIIKNEATSILHSLVNKVQSLSNEVDAKYLLKTCLYNIEYLLRSVARELKALPSAYPVYNPSGNESDESRIKMNTHVVFYTLKVTLIRLYFEVLTTFSTLLGNIGRTEDELYRKVLHETPPDIKVDELGMKLLTRQAEIIVDEIGNKKIESIPWFENLQNFYSKNQANSKLQAAITALENLMYINNFLNSEKQFTFHDLHSPQLSNRLFEEAKKEYKKEINKIAFGHERFDKIGEIIDSLVGLPFNTFAPDEPLQYSIPRRIIQWLNQQKELYKKHFSKDFSTSQQVKPSSKPKSQRPPDTLKNVSNESFTYKLLSVRSDNLTDLHNSLKKNGFISEDTTASNFKKIFTGKSIESPVVWTGKISDLYYFVKLIHNINKSVEYLNQNHWFVACKCFIQSDGQKFDRFRLKGQKKPQSTCKLLEKAAKLI